jgi:hypothetical protein
MSRLFPASAVSFCVRGTLIQTPDQPAIGRLKFQKNPSHQVTPFYTTVRIRVKAASYTT